MQFKNVAAYCRVSTENIDQANSLESQKRYFGEYIERQPFWNLAEIYVDEGITGTSTEKRLAFNQMIADACAHKFDLIITKEISRFARNTLDSIFYTRKLKELGIGVIFMNDGINTLEPDAELRLTIMSSIAQEESRKTSGRVKWGQRRRMEQGVVFGRDMLGYDVKDGKLYINEDGAATVRLIFHKFVNENKGTHIIARDLREAGVKTSTHMKKWSNTVILRVLRNEKYCGDLVQKKTFTPNYLTHDKKINKGEEELVILRDHHEPIISRELFVKAQAELARRAPTEEQKSKHSNRYCFSGKIKCGVCGNSFVARSKKRGDDSTYKAWRCYEGAKSGAPHIDKVGNEVGCACPSLNDGDAKQLMGQVMANLKMDREGIVKNLTQIIKSAIDVPDDKASKLQTKLQQTTDKKQRLLEMYLDKEVGKEDFQAMSTKLEAEIESLKSELKAVEKQADMQKNIEKLLADMATIIRGITSGENWDDCLYSQLLDKITVYADNKIEVRLKLLPNVFSFTRVNHDATARRMAAAPCRHYGTSVPGFVSLWYSLFSLAKYA